MAHDQGRGGGARSAAGKSPSPEMKAHIQRSLRRVYEEVAKEDLPQHLLDLLAPLDAEPAPAAEETGKETP